MKAEEFAARVCGIGVNFINHYPALRLKLSRAQAGHSNEQSGQSYLIVTM